MKIGILGGMGDWRNPDRFQLTTSMEIDAMRRKKPFATLESPIAACFKSESDGETRQSALVRESETGFPTSPIMTSVVWMTALRTPTDDMQAEQALLIPWGRFRMGRTPMTRDETHRERLVSHQSRLNAMAQPLNGRDKTKFFLDTLAPGGETGYSRAWNQWRDFPEQRGRTHWITPDIGGRCGANFLEFLLFHQHVMARKAVSVRAKVASVRYFHLVRGAEDFALYATRAQTLPEGLEKRGLPYAKRQFDADLIAWMAEHMEADDQGNHNERGAIFESAILWFFFLLRISEISQIRKSDIKIETANVGDRILLAVRMSKTDHDGEGVTRALTETKFQFSPGKGDGRVSSEEMHMWR